MASTAAPETSGAARSNTRARRRSENNEEASGGARYFLAKAETNSGAPALDREVASEGEALVEALRLGVTYYALQEFRVIPDFSGRMPQLKKETVRDK